ncbi:TPA: hypothetical protein P0E29_005037 [Vibrio harveyi]|nr:hypothetical protein [Vibrio harveyi]
MVQRIRDWYLDVKAKVGKFMLALLLSYLFVAMALVGGFPQSIIAIALGITLVIPFGLFVMLATENVIYEKINSKNWGKATIWVFIIAYTSLAGLWAAEVVNSIFKVSPSNFPLTMTILSVIYFFKNIILVGAVILTVSSVLYANLWASSVFVLNYRGVWGCIRDIFGALVFLLGLGLLIGSSNFLASEKEEIARLVAVATDFSAHHNCQGEIYTTSNGVLFLPTGKVLVAESTTDGTFGFSYKFSEHICKPET